MSVRRRRPPSDDVLLQKVHTLAGDGFCPASEVTVSLHDFERRGVVKALKRAANRGLLLERHGPDGRRYVGLASEGWRLLS